MELYVQSSRGFSSYAGMDQETIVRLLTELGVTDIMFIDQDTFDTNTQQ